MRLPLTVALVTDRMRLPLTVALVTTGLLAVVSAVPREQFV